MSMPPPRRQRHPSAELRTRSMQNVSHGVRLRFNTNDNYEMHSYKSEQIVIVKPSRFRGWMRKMTGEFKVCMDYKLIYPCSIAPLLSLVAIC